MVQSPANRLLTEAAAALTYRTAAQVDTQADARIAAKRGTALGIAALGADGIVPAAQLPPTATPGGFAAITATVALTSSTTTPADVGLNTAVIAAGSYYVAADLLTVTNSPVWRLFRSATGITSSSLYVESIAAGSPPAFVAGRAAATVNNVGGINLTRIRGVVTLSAPQVCNLDVSGAGGSVVLQPGSFVSLRPVS